jgi:hypothetical protein
VLHVENSSMWYSNLDTSYSRAEIQGKFWNVAVENDVEDQLHRSCEKWNSNALC